VFEYPTLEHKIAGSNPRHRVGNFYVHCYAVVCNLSCIGVADVKIIYEQKLKSIEAQYLVYLEHFGRISQIYFWSPLALTKLCLST
jgi:hypothetical protein